MEIPWFIIIPILLGTITPIQPKQQGLFFIAQVPSINRHYNCTVDRTRKPPVVGSLFHEASTISYHSHGMKKPCDITLYWSFNRDPWNGSNIISIITG